MINRHLMLVVIAVLLTVGLALHILVMNLHVTTKVVLGPSSENAPASERILNLMDYVRIGSSSGQFSAYYSDRPWQEMAQEALAYLEAAEQLLEDRLGLSLGRLAIVLIPYQQGVQAMILQLRGWEALRQILQLDPILFPLVVAPGLSSLLQQPFSVRFFAHWVIVHEGVESQVARKLYFRDRNARWVGEGLAEYAAYVVTQELDREVACEGWKSQQLRLNMGLERGLQKYDLTNDFPVRDASSRGQDGKGNASDAVVEQVGYALAFSFWYRIAQQHGEKTIRAFWERLSRQWLPSAQDALSILKQLTGEDIKGWLQGIELGEIQSQLQAHDPCKNAGIALYFD